MLRADGVREKSMRFPNHKCGLFLTHNEHRDYYQTVEAWLADRNDHFTWKDEQSKRRAIESGEVWTLQWYPDTPIGFCIKSAADLDALMEAVNER